MLCLESNDPDKRGPSSMSARIVFNGLQVQALTRPLLEHAGISLHKEYMYSFYFEYTVLYSECILNVYMMLKLPFGLIGSY